MSEDNRGVPDPARGCGWLALGLLSGGLLFLLAVFVPWERWRR